MFLLLPLLASANMQDNQKTDLRDRVIVAKGDKQFAPFEFINAAGEPDGFSVELFRELMKKLGIKYTLTLDDWADVQDQLNNKQIDLAIGMIYSHSRAEKAKFGIPHCMISYNIICRRDNNILTINALRGRRIIVQNKDRAHEYLLSTQLTDKITPVAKIEEGIQLLAAGNHDALLSFDISSFYFVRQGHYKNLIVHLTDNAPEKYSIAVNTDNEELLYLLNAALYQMKIDGDYDRIYYKWFGVYEKTKASQIVWYILGVLGIFLLVLAGFIWLLRIKVRQSTRDLKLKNDETLKLVGKLRDENRIRLVAEKHLIQAKERAEESDRLKSAFLANISHEIRTPLNAIVGFSSILCATEDADEREKLYEIIAKNNELLLQLINDVLDLSKIESGIMIMNSSSFSLGELCNQALTSVGSGFSQEKVKLVAQIDFDGQLYSDRARLAQVITNFLNNAIKFTDQGSVTLRTHKVGGQNKVEISVTDTGIGIEKEHLRSVFDRFVKLNTFSQGTGLGLSICKHIIEKLGGEICVESELGKGSRFWVRLPLEE